MDKLPLLQKQLFVTNDDIAICYLEVVRGQLIIPASSNYIICITISNNQNNNVPRLHSLKERTKNDYFPKKSWPLKTLQVIEGSNNFQSGLDFNLVFGGKSLNWVAFSHEKMLEFFYFFMEVYRQAFRSIPQMINLNIEDLNLLGETLAEKHRNLYSNSSNQNMHTNALSNIFRNRDITSDEKDVFEDKMQVPLMTVEEAVDVQYFLDQFNLTIADIHLLEPYLLKKLEYLESQNILALFDSNKPRDIVLTDIDNSVDKLDEASSWLHQSDYHLEKMRSAIEQIDSKNKNLEVLERNHERLQDCLTNLIYNLELDFDTVKILKNPNFEDSLYNVIKAGNQLKEKIKGRFAISTVHKNLLSRNLAVNKMVAIQEKYKDHDKLRDTFCSSISNYLTNYFLVVAKQYDKQLQNNLKSNSNCAYWESMDDSVFDPISKFFELGYLLFYLDLKQFSKLAVSYGNSLSKPLANQCKSFFSSAKSLINNESKDSRLASCSDYSIENALNKKKISPDYIQEDEPNSPKQIIRIVNKSSFNQIFGKVIESILQAVVGQQAFLSNFMNFPVENEEKFVTTEHDEDEDLNDEEKIIQTIEDPKIDFMNHRIEKINELLIDLFRGLRDELKAFADIGHKMDPFTSLSMILRVERYMKRADSNCCQFMVICLAELQTHLKLHFNTFVQEQVTWLEDYKVSAKQSGILVPFLKFPTFVERIERIVVSWVNSDVVYSNQDVDTTFHKLLGTMFRCLDFISKQDPKYTDIVVMENCHYFQIVFSNRPQNVQVLSQYLTQSVDLYRTHEENYVKWSISYEMPDVTKYWEGLEEALKRVSPDDVQFTQGLRKTDLRELYKNHLTSKSVEKSISNVANRVHKHLPKNPYLEKEVLRAIDYYFKKKFKRFQEIISMCYSQEKIPISIADVNRIFIAILGSHSTMADELSLISTER